MSAAFRVVRCDAGLQSLAIERAGLARASVELVPARPRSEEEMIATIRDADGLLSVYLINTSRGAVLVEAVLVEALRAGWLAGGGPGRADQRAARRRPSAAGDGESDPYSAHRRLAGPGGGRRPRRALAEGSGEPGSAGKDHVGRVDYWSPGTRRSSNMTMFWLSGQGQ